MREKNINFKNEDRSLIVSSQDVIFLKKIHIRIFHNDISDIDGESIDAKC